MNTPAHLVVALLVVPNRREDLLLFAAVVIGAILPDAPMILFYGFEKLVLNTPESIIWSEKYYDPKWQDFFDAFNSIPIIALGLLAAFSARMPRLAALFTSMLIHTLCDLPVHHDDGHRHFFPLSDFVFSSPVSYWDSNHYGHWFLRFELVVVLLGTAFLIWRANRNVIRLGYGLIGLTYVAFGIFVMSTWATMD